jgi:hypothetical protein
MIMGIRVRVYKELIGVGSGWNKRALYVNLIRVLAGERGQCISKRGDVMLDVIHVPEMQGSNPLP